MGSQFLQEWYLDDLVFFHGQNSTRRDEGGLTWEGLTCLSREPEVVLDSLLPGEVEHQSLDAPKSS